MRGGRWLVDDRAFPLAGDVVCDLAGDAFAELAGDALAELRVTRCCTAASSARDTSRIALPRSGSSVTVSAVDDAPAGRRPRSCFCPVPTGGAAPCCNTDIFEYRIKTEILS